MKRNTLSRLLLALLSIIGAYSGHAQVGPHPPGRVHLYLLAGQSNMAGRGTVEAADRQTHPRIWVLDKTNTWVPAADPLHFDKPAVVGVGPGMAFARVMAEADPNAIIALIPVAVGGSPIDSWQPGGFHEQTQSHPYDDALTRARIALQSGTLRGILWHQGESDAKAELAPAYADKLSQLIRRFRSDLNALHVPVVVGTLGDFHTDKNPYAVQINNALQQVARRESRVACVKATGLTHKGDQTHFDTPSARELGKRYAKAMQPLLKK
ncbi:sialate O-acetylesterase [Rudanella paleaurantiibacter]|uniref:Sialate O-acetylesterase n=1 Tax=Rudanella paleaurantiibacter TaxID=2614655 RepID=A0A7J5TY66_9BACT|nr:sialate O-acetylesterase [Rudanella paleaurantiibacter]KAB7730011.1 sialate O-acetylesterase [Rudanella paleaurantiibacter]